LLCRARLLRGAEPVRDARLLLGDARLLLGDAGLWLGDARLRLRDTRLWLLDVRLLGGAAELSLRSAQLSRVARRRLFLWRCLLRRRLRKRSESGLLRHHAGRRTPERGNCGHETPSAVWDHDRRM
jgi:hypothetical protein